MIYYPFILKFLKVQHYILLSFILSYMKMCEVKRYLPHTRAAEIAYKTDVKRTFNLRQNGDSL